MEWISVKDRLPDENQRVFIHFKDAKWCVYETMFKDDDFWIYDYQMDDYIFPLDKPMGITHWMPLPEPPKE